MVKRLIFSAPAVALLMVPLAMTQGPYEVVSALWLVVVSVVLAWIVLLSDTATAASPTPTQTASQRRSERIRNNGGRHTQSEWKALCALYDYRCLRCGRKRPLTADHIVPVEQGGSSDIDNIQPLCGPCNSTKGTRTIDYREAMG